MGKWGSGEVGRINKNNLLTPISYLLSPVSFPEDLGLKLEKVH